MEVTETDEQYIVSQIAEQQKADEPAAAKAWIIAAQTLLPNSFRVQFETYKMHKLAGRLEKAAKTFSYIALTFQNNNIDLWNEAVELANALRVPEKDITPEDEFYVKMFQFVEYDVQQEILLLTVNNNQNALNQCKLLLLLFKRFPQIAAVHLTRLMELVTEGMQTSPDVYIELIDKESQPLMSLKAASVRPAIVNSLFTTAFEYYLRDILDEGAKCDMHLVWRKIFHVLNLCGKLANWESHMTFNKLWSPKMYWEKLMILMPNAKPGSSEVLFSSLTVFVYCLHSYIRNCTARQDVDATPTYVLVEGFTDWKMETREASKAPPLLSSCSDLSDEISKAFLYAAQCWQLLNSEAFQGDFSKLLGPLKLTKWLSRFLLDLAMYFDHTDEANKLMAEVSNKTELVHNIQVLSLNLLQGSLTLQGFECISKIMADLPQTGGQLVDELTQNMQRHMIFIPLTQNVLIQYCTKAIVNALSRKLYEPNCPDVILGDLLVLLQLEYPRDTMVLEQIFSLITSRRSFVYRYFTAYVVTTDFLEEFLFVYNTHADQVRFELTPVRRLEETGPTKREDLFALIKQQLVRSNENITTLVGNFISQEHSRLMQNIFESTAEPAEGGGGGVAGGVVAGGVVAGGVVAGAVVGSGSGGESAANDSNASGSSVAVVETNESNEFIPVIAVE